MLRMPRNDGIGRLERARPELFSRRLCQPSRVACSSLFHIRRLIDWQSQGLDAIAPALVQQQPCHVGPRIMSGRIGGRLCDRNHAQIDIGICLLYTSDAADE